MSRSRCNATPALSEAEPVDYTPGRASVHSSYRGDERDGRAAVLDGQSLTAWLVWDWSRATDERLETLSADTYDLADRVHQLNITIMVAFIIILIALGVLIGTTIL